MAGLLLERDAELTALRSALVAAGSGSGSTVLVHGEAGVGKTSVVRAFLAGLAGRERVLSGACDDLLTARVLGPLHDAARAAPAGPLAAALAGADRGAVLSAVVEELSHARGPTVLVVEDAHWADDATVDVLRYVGRRIADCSGLLLITYRDGEIGLGHPLHRVLGGLSGGSVLRLPLQRLSRAAVSRWTGGTNVTSAGLYQLTGGNPFFLSEVLAAPDDVVPASVVDAVLARTRQLEPAAQRAMEQLAVVPSQVELPLARALLPDLTAVAAAERIGMIEVRAHAVAFRHELARLAIVGAMPASDRMVRNGAVLTALLAAEQPDLARVVHHAVEAGDGAAVVRYAPEAARRAGSAGAQRQAAALYAQALRHAALLPADQRAALNEAHAWTLFHSSRRHGAIRAAEEAVRLREELAEPAALGQALACLALQQWSDLRPAAAVASSERAVRLLAIGGDSPQLVSATIYLGVVLINVDREREGLEQVDAALAMAHRISAPAFVPMGRIYRGRALLQLGEPAGLEELLGGLEQARVGGDHQTVMFGYLNLVGLLWRFDRYAELAQWLAASDEYGREHDFPAHQRGCAAYRFRLQALHGDWDGAERGMLELLGDSTDGPKADDTTGSDETGGDENRSDYDDGADQGVIGRHVLSGLALIAVRRGADDASRRLTAARQNAERADSLQAMVPTVVGELELAWSTGSFEPAREAALALLPRAEQPGREHDRGRLLRGLRRIGGPADPFPGCPEEYAAGLRGDWAAAAAAWERIGDPYERALELLESNEVEPTTTALRLFDDLGARPAAARARARLRELGVTAVPRGPQRVTRANPAGLTDRQLEILGLLAEGMTNPQIAARLVVSVRTVDHHVSAVLQKLGVTSRRAAVAAAAGLVPGG